MKCAHRLAALALAAALAACASPTGVEPKAAPADPASLGLAASADTPWPWPAPDWWRQYGDPRLDALVERALAGNPTLRVAAARLARAQAGAEIEQAAAQPQVAGALDVTRQRYSRFGLPPPPLGGSLQTASTLALNGSWELDFFGRHQAALDAAIGQANAARADLAAARTLLAAQVTRAWMQWASLAAQRELAMSVAQLRERRAALVERRVRAGLDSAVELRQAQADLPLARQRVDAIDERIALTRNALAALSTQPAGALPERAPAPPDLARAALPSSLPLDLIGRRADITAARWRVQASVRDRDAAAAQFHPNVNLVAFVGLSSLGLSRLLEAPSLIAGAGPAVRLPIFDAGRLRANLRVRTADLDAAVESYNATLADAVRDVADQVDTLRALARQRTELAALVETARQSLELARARRRAGLAGALPELAAEDAELAASLAAQELAARVLDTDVNLMRALGGGYDDAAPLAQR